MTLRTDSYSSVAEVLAFTRYFLNGQTTFNSTTRPTATEVETFIDRASGLLNVAIEGQGMSSPITNTTAKLSCSDWVTARAVTYVELTSRGAGYSEGEGSRIGAFLSGLAGDANKFAKDNAKGFKNLGVTQDYKLSDGLVFTALDAQSERTDPDDSTLAQPAFIRGQFDNDYADTE